MELLETKLVNDYSDIPARAVRIKHANGSLITPAYAVNAAKTGLLAREDTAIGGIIEVSLAFRPNQLERMSRDVTLQQRFEYRVNSYTRRARTYGKLVVAIPLVEEAREHSFSKNEAIRYGTYIAELTANPGIDIVCTPVFNRIAEKNIPLLVESFLEAMTAYDVGVVLSIPYTSRETREKLVELYLNKISKNNRLLLSFTCADYNASNPISKYAFHNYVLRYTKSLEEDIIGEPVAVYGVNVKYDRVSRKYDKLPARDIAAYFARLDILGGNHKRKPMPREVVERLRAKEPPVRRIKLLDRSQYIYLDLDKAIQSEQGIPGIEPIKRIIKENPRTLPRHVEREVERINTSNILAETIILQRLFSGQGYQAFKDPSHYLGSKEIMRIDDKLLKALKGFNRILGLGTKKLDKYLSP